MSRKSRGRTTGPRYKQIRTQEDFTAWLNRAFSRGGKGTSHVAQKRRKPDFYGIFGPKRRGNKH